MVPTSDPWTVLAERARSADRNRCFVPAAGARVEIRYETGASARADPLLNCWAASGRWKRLPTALTHLTRETAVAIEFNWTAPIDGGMQATDARGRFRCRPQSSSGYSVAVFHYGGSLSAGIGEDAAEKI